jgi:8-amino-7-oxononanoate synthase
MPATDLDIHLARAIEERKARNALRALTLPGDRIDFCSNDYLGFARSPRLRSMVQEHHARRGNDFVGSTGSRLISGNSKLCESVEERIADFHEAEAGLIFNSGYDANLGLISSVPQRSDTVLYDELVHASIRDGLRLTFARSYSFRHNDLDDLKQKIGRGRGQVFVAVESVYSMDGDAAPLSEMAKLCREHGCHLIVDEAHATGIFGPGGRGRTAELDLTDQVFARVHTFGKALGSHGAIVLGSDTLRTFLINFARSFIYTTFLPPHSLLAVESAYEMLDESQELIEKLHRNIRLFRSGIPAELGKSFIESDSPIQCSLISGNDCVKQAAGYLRGEGFDVRPILSPTVPRGKERLRVCLHTFNTPNEIQHLTELLRTCLKDVERATVAEP